MFGHFKKHKNRKVFGIGWPRTGTSTLGACFDILNYRQKKSFPDFHSFFLDVKYKRWDRIFELVDRYDAFRDWPWPLIYKELDRRYPGSRFILTLRDPAERYESYLRLLQNNPSIGVHASPEFDEIRQFIYGETDPAGKKELYMRMHEDHDRRIIEYFKGREQDLLCIDLTREGNRWKRLCEFLERPVPDMPFPHLNKSPAIQ